jgi:membrane protease YdiL (CAAX protease family)
MKTTNQKAVNLILRGVAIQFIPSIILGKIAGVIARNIVPLSLAFALLLLLILLVIAFSFLIGYIYFIKGCCLYIASKGHSSKWGLLGLLSLPGLSILLLIPYKKNAVNLEESLGKNLENNPFKRISILGLFLSCLTLVSSISLILAIFCLLNNLNYADFVESSSIVSLLIIFIYIYFLYIIFRECKNSGLIFKQIIGDNRYISLKLIVLIAVLQYAFRSGFGSLFLYNLSFISPEYVENYINKKYYTNILEIIAYSFLVMPLALFAEEFFIRGIVLQKWAIKWGVRTGVLTSSLLFAILYFDHTIIYSFIGGIIYSILYFKTRSLIAPLLCHFFYNIINIIFVVSNYFSKSAIEKSALMSVNDYQGLIQPLLGQRVFLIAISVPFLIYFVYKNFPKNDAIIPYYANEARIPETN